jgi:hypothetical protein
MTLNAKDPKERLKIIRPQVAELLKKIQEIRRGIVDFCDWMGKYHKETKGFKRSSVAKILIDIDTILSGEQATVSPGTALAKAEEFVSYATEYLSEEKIHDFPGTAYFVYFFYLIKPEKVPKLGRAVLRFTEQDRVHLKNVPETSKDYTGRYTQVNQVIFIDLQNSRNHKLHMKLECPDGAEQELSLGSYSTIDNYRIVTGELVLHKIDPMEIPEEKQTPALLSYGDKETGKEFDQGVDQAIRDYLCIKNMNYHSVPQSITTISALRKHLDFYNPFEGRKRRMFDPGKPRIFVAVPSSTYHKHGKETEKVKNLITALKEKHGHNFVKEKNSETAIDFERRPIENLKLLHRTSVFILIVTQKDVFSFAYLQAGYAVALCKHVIILYKEPRNEKETETVSARVKSLASIGVERISFKDFGESWDEGENRLIKLLDDYLRESY